MDKSYQDEPISGSSNSFPEPLRAMRAMERSYTQRTKPASQIFLEQALLLEDYEDDYEYDKRTIQYYPTYQSLTNRELRAYFSWRTKWRKGDQREGSFCFAFLYIYELLHLVGASDAEDAYSKLLAFYNDYAVFNSEVTTYLDKWLLDFIVYYRLDTSLLADREEIRRDNAMFVLMTMPSRTDDEIWQAVLELSSFVVTNSRFYKKYPEMTENVIVNVLRYIEMHYTKKNKKIWTENYFGSFVKWPARLFEGAIFYDRNTNLVGKVKVSPVRYYSHAHGRWTLSCYDFEDGHHKKFHDLLRTIDSSLRTSVNFPYPIKSRISTKWILRAIDEEIQAWQEAEQQAKKKKLKLDLSQLENIRSDATETRDKLITEEEIEEVPEQIFEEDATGSSKESSTSYRTGFDALSQSEKRYLQCLIDGSPTNWVISEGFLPSLLCDSINEKLFDIFDDTVLENGEIVEDYKEELKEGLLA